MPSPLDGHNLCCEPLALMSLTTRGATFLPVPVNMITRARPCHLRVARERGRLTRVPKLGPPARAGDGCCSTASFLDARNRARKIPCGERGEVVDALANADEVDRQREFRGDGDEYAAARGPIEFRHHEASDAGYL
jgi:hypothetical protein